MNLKLCDVKFKFEVIKDRIQFWCIILAVSPTDKTLWGYMRVFTYFTYILRRNRGTRSSRPLDLATSKDRPNVGRAYVLARPGRPPDVREVQCRRILGTRDPRRISKSIKVIIINLQLLYHNEEVIYLNLN